MSHKRVMLTFCWGARLPGNLDAARLADAGHIVDAVPALNRLLEEEPGYAFAAMLKKTLEAD